MGFRKGGLLFLMVLLLGACADEPLPQNAPARPAATAAEPAGRVIVAMGDSLTAGYGLDETEAYPAVLETRLKADGHRWRVVNAGISGETSSGALSRVDWILTSLKPDLVILVTGANDGMRGIDPELLRDNLRALVRRLQQAGAVVVIGGMRMLRNLGADYTAAFDAIYPAVARETGAVLIPFFLEGVAGEARLNQADGIHPTAEGYRRIVERIYPVILKAAAATGKEGIE